MATCALTGRKISFGRNIRYGSSGSSWLRRAQKTNRSFKPNVQAHTIYDPELGYAVRLTLSAHALRIINRKGLLRAFQDEGMSLKDLLRVGKRVD
ncbi:MAG: hypothetical protein Fur005_20340 [Roseiflexaceae bacterium]